GAYGVEAQIEDAPYQLLQALDQVEGRDAEHRKDDADHDREQHQSDQSARNAVAEELLPVHAAGLLAFGCDASAPRSRISIVYGVVTNRMLCRCGRKGVEARSLPRSGRPAGLA